MQLFEFEYEIEISTQPAKSIGTEEDWRRALEALYNALDSQGLDYGICAGEGAFYGPKIDIKLKDALGRHWQCATIQCDFTLPDRFDLYYIGTDGEKHRPVMLHRVILGAVERFMGVLIEHYAGALPTWLMPVQVKILTITDDHIPYAQQCVDFFQQQGLRLETDFRNEKLGFKIREAQVSKVPYTFVIGDKEVQESQVNVRMRGKNQSFPMGCREAVNMVRQDCLEPFTRGGMNYSFIY
jgi:threonyl-tRNA synthetase